jgi:EthD domain
MVKLICFVKRNAALSVDEFHRHWREQHARLLTETPAARARILRYEQNHRVMRDYERDDHFDGVAIQWFASAREFFSMITDPEYQAAIGPDERYLLDLERTTWMLTDAEETVFGQ